MTTSVEYFSDNEREDESLEGSNSKEEDFKRSANQNKFLNLHRGNVQFHRLLRMMLSIVCCILYISQTWLSPSSYPYPSYCCGIAEYTTQPCLLESYRNGSVGFYMQRIGCVYTNKLLKISLNARSQYVLSNSSQVSFSELTVTQQCRSYCRKGDNCSDDVTRNCDCSIVCGDTLYCGIYETEDCNGFNYLKLIFYEKPLWLYLLQIVSSLLAMSYAIVRSILLWKRGLWITKIIDGYFIIDCMNGAISLSSIAYVPCLKDLYIPLFLQCFTARMIINNILYSFDFTFSQNKFITPVMQKITAAILGLACILFSFTCAVHYLERIACPQSSHVTTLFQSLWFVVVTITTVGYGDKYPGTPLGQLSVIFLILIILLFLPKTLNDVLELIDDSKQNYKFYTGRRKYKHVVLCVSKLDMTLLNDYLDEFYSQEDNLSLVTVILTSQSPTPLVKIRLSSSLWKKKVLVIVGSALKQRDLERVKLELAKACILLSDRTTEDAQFADQETILRASSIQRLAPHVKLYVHILKPENRMNVKFANQVICEGQLKQVLMANNCIYPGLSSFLTLLLRTTSPDKGKGAASWQRLYDYGSGNEIYDIKLENSLLFSGLVGRNFLFASVVILRTTQVLLFAVKPANETEILLNPGRHHILQNDDTLYYISQDREEEMFVEGGISDKEIRRIGKIFMPTAPHPLITGKDSSLTRTQDSCLGDSIQVEETQLPNPGYRRQSSRSKRESRFVKQRAINDIEAGKVDDQPQSKLTPLLKSLTIGHTFHPIHFRSDHSHEKGLSQKDFHGRMSGMLQDSSQTLELQSLVDTDMGNTNEVLENLYNRGSETTNISVNRVPTYFGVKETVRHLNNQPLRLCCLQSGWKISCHDSEFKAIKTIQQPDEGVERMLFLTGYKRPLIVCANEAGSQLYEFLLPLRAYHIPTEELIPIVLVLPNIPDVAFLEAISWIPHIKFLVGNQDSVDDLIIAGALDAVGIIICLGDGTPEFKEEGNMVDASRISTAQKMSQIFVNTKFYVELTDRWSMRYLKLENGHSFHTLMPKSIRDFIHTPYFMSSQAFAPSMMDTLLYQCTQKDYILELVHLLLGLKQTPGSAYIGKVEVTQSDIDTYQTYGRLMLNLANANNDLPLAIYRTRFVRVKSSLEKMNYEYDRTKVYLEKRAQHLKIFDPIPDSPTELKHSHILVNPPVNTPLKRQDVLLVLKVCSQEQYNIVHNFKSPTRRPFLLPKDLSGCSEDSEEDHAKLSSSRMKLSFRKLSPGFQKRKSSGESRQRLSSFLKQRPNKPSPIKKSTTEIKLIKNRGKDEKSHSFDLGMLTHPTRSIFQIKRQSSLDIQCPDDNRSDQTTSRSDTDCTDIFDSPETPRTFDEVKAKPVFLNAPRVMKQPSRKPARKVAGARPSSGAKHLGLAAMFLKKRPQKLIVRKNIPLKKQNLGAKRRIYANSLQERPEITITSIDMETQCYSLNDY